LDSNFLAHFLLSSDSFHQLFQSAHPYSRHQTEPECIVLHILASLHRQRDGLANFARTCHGQSWISRMAHREKCPQRATIARHAFPHNNLVHPCLDTSRAASLQSDLLHGPLQVRSQSLCLRSTALTSPWCWILARCHCLHVRKAEGNPSHMVVERDCRSNQDSDLYKH
jgi:hypothetical protein